jgi:hypothetical protein
MDLSSCRGLLTSPWPKSICSSIAWPSSHGPTIYLLASIEERIETGQWAKIRTDKKPGIRTQQTFSIEVPGLVVLALASFLLSGSEL